MSGEAPHFAARHTRAWQAVCSCGRTTVLTEPGGLRRRHSPPPAGAFMVSRGRAVLFRGRGTSGRHGVHAFASCFNAWRLSRLLPRQPDGTRALSVEDFKTDEERVGRLCGGACQIEAGPEERGPEGAAGRCWRPDRASPRCVRLLSGRLWRSCENAMTLGGKEMLATFERGGWWKTGGCRGRAASPFRFTAETIWTLDWCAPCFAWPALNAPGRRSRAGPGPTSCASSGAGANRQLQGGFPW